MSLQDLLLAKPPVHPSHISGTKNFLYVCGMFTGIIETTGVVKEVVTQGSNRVFLIESPISETLKPDQSVSHNGVCLTVETVTGNCHTVTAIDETLKKTNLSDWQAGAVVNLERCMVMNRRLDGHIVQGHVDTVAVCTAIQQKEGSTEFTFSLGQEHAGLIIEKGSISLNGISLTIFNVGLNCFSVAIIPYTMNHTNMNTLHEGQKVNIEFDIIGKYILRQQQVGSNRS
ncbi:MAG: riboflavin synthase [Niabella sp.]